MLPFQEAYAKDNEVEKWASKTLQPAIDSNVKSFNDSWEKNWNVNISAHLINGDKYKTLDKLENLRTDIQNSQEAIKEIKAAKQANKEQKENLKLIIQDLDKAFSTHDKQVEKMIKVIDKDKKIKSTDKYDKKINKSNKQLAETNKAYAKLQKELKLDIKEINFNEIVTINEEKATEILRKDKERKDKAAMKKAEKEEKLRIENENKVIAELEEKLKNQQATYKEKKEAFEKEITDLKASNTTLTTEVATLKSQASSKAANSTASSSGSGSATPAPTPAASSESEWFQNCTELRKKYPSGVASSHPAYQSKMDRDKDEWACER